MEVRNSELRSDHSERACSFRTFRQGPFRSGLPPMDFSGRIHLYRVDIPLSAKKIRGYSAKVPGPAKYFISTKTLLEPYFL
ncbi:unnamed protein product [Caenorhabditis angaria]|uniref:Uncharacterized protein n=1 Tax=Caenorhabditis angaria TaxID=860376 RepID=A0A9P1J353_9PELO|nr:unnamed protein product [Caenorhabditis angaria]